MADYDAIVIGAGFGGIRALWELAQLGLTAKCFEAGSDVGGAWYWNRYPGARTDSEAWVYAMNFAPGMSEEWNYSERYPSQEEVQMYLGRVADKFNLRRLIDFNVRIEAAYYSDKDGLWTITTTTGASTTCRYFLPATGPLTIAKELPFPGLKSFTGQWYEASKWPKHKIDFRGKRVAVVGTGATGVQIVPKIAAVTKQLTVFQRTANYVLPGRNYTIDEHQSSSIKGHFDDTWNYASSHPAGLAMVPSGKTTKDLTDSQDIQQALDAGWEQGGFHFQFETLDDIARDEHANKIASDYVRNKIHAIVKDQETATLLCPKHPFGSKRPPCGHFYYEAFNLPQVKLVDISQDELDLYENGIRLSSGKDYEFDIIIFALGFDAATGALTEMDVRGSQGKSLKDSWSKRLETYAGVLVPGFPNMFSICGPHVPFGNMPVVSNAQVAWIGQTLKYMEENDFAQINVSEGPVEEWQSHVKEVFKSTLMAKSAKDAGAWFVGANIPGKASDILFYFGGLDKWKDWLNKEARSEWASMDFTPRKIDDVQSCEKSSRLGSGLSVDVTLKA